MKINKLIGCLAVIAVRLHAVPAIPGDSAASAPVTITVTNSPSCAIPEDFCGLSFGAVAELPGHGGVPGHMFNATNEQLLTLFKNSGLHHLRLGGTTVEGTNAAIPDRSAVDDVFAFAKSAEVKVLCSFPLLNGNSASNAIMAQYIWSHFQPQLDCFALGNEPDVRRYLHPPFGFGTDPAITNYASFLKQWRRFAAAIVQAAPDATFAGPDAANHAWAPMFARDEKDSRMVTLITQHYYAGGRPYIGDGPDKIPAQEAIDRMLSANWPAVKYPDLCKTTLVPVQETGLRYRLTESDDYLKGIDNASDSFASALWALEYLHWWAARGGAGVNFHNTEWLKTDTVYFDEASRAYQIHPKAYGVKMFELGSGGRVEPVGIANPNGLNLSAYGVAATNALCVTILNKEHGPGARDAAVTLAFPGFSPGRAVVMFLSAPHGDIGATGGMTLGGGAITNNATWQGEWQPLRPGESGQLFVKVPAASAALVKTMTH